MLDESFFASDDIVSNSVNIGGRDVVMHFRELTAVEFHACFVAQDGSGQKVLSPALLISECLCNPDGSPAITAERAAQLKAAPFNAILKKVMEINGETSPGNASPSAEKTGSGTP